MNASPDFIESEYENFNKLKLRLWYEAGIFNKVFASDEIQGILKIFIGDIEPPNEDWDKPAKLELLYQVLEKLHGYADDNTYEILDTFFTNYDGVTELFIPLKKVLSEMDKINSAGIVSVSPFTLVFNVYKFYLPFKLLAALMKKFNLVKIYDGKEITLATGGVIKFFQNKSNRLKNEDSVIKSEFDNWMVNYENLIEVFKRSNILPDIEAEKIIRDLSSGRIEDEFIVPLYHNSFTNLSDNVTERKKMLLLFDFFRTVLPDRKWKTEAEFNAAVKSDTAGYDNNYETYKYRTMRKFITKS